MLNPNVNALPTAITGGTTNNIPAHLEEVKDAINNGSLLRRLSQAQRDALSGDQRPVGLWIHNLTSGRAEQWTGAKWEAAAHEPEWVSFAPTITATMTDPTGWSGAGVYAKIGKVVHVRGQVTFVPGSGPGPLGTVGAGDYRLALPVSASTDAPLVQGSFFMDSGAGATTMGAVGVLASAGLLALYMPAPEGVYQVGAGYPFGWWSGASIKFAFTYQAA